MPVRMPAMSIVPDGREAQTTQALSPEPRCGQCGYCVRGIEGLICPECGSDLREVGIVTGRSRWPIPLWAQLALWSFLLLTGAILLTVFLLRTVVPFGQTTKAHRTISFWEPSNLTLDAWGISRQWRPAMMDPHPAPPVEFEVVDSRRMSSLQINLSCGAYRYRRSDGTIVQQSSGFDGGVLADWLTTGGSGAVVNTADPNFRKLCDSACSALSEIPKGSATVSQFTPLLVVGGQRAGIAHPAYIWTTCDNPHPLVLVALALLWLIAWIYGIRRIYRRNPPSIHRGDSVSSAIQMPQPAGR